MRLNLACGSTRWPGFENSDINGSAERFVDLNEFPYPYENDSAEIVMISHALFMTVDGAPAISDLAGLLRECHRILVPGGWLRIADNPHRCFAEGEELPAEEVAAEASRGYPPELRMRRSDLECLLRKVGFSSVLEVSAQNTAIPGDEELRGAIIGNHLFHLSFALEAQK